MNTFEFLLFYPDGCPACHTSIYLTSDLSLQPCGNCSWIEGDTGYIYREMLPLEEYCGIIGALYKQRKANLLDRAEYMEFIQKRIGLK